MRPLHLQSPAFALLLGLLFARFFCELAKNLIFGNSSVARVGLRFRFLEWLLAIKFAYLLLEILFLLRVLC